ncbi:glycosyl transferase [Capsulimonas corticalis]|uniref:Glycosyl transferase n=1 Tax=Capsulimonas corticalis TaxID=2219043 RepID=A0A402CPC8_9BACT|nr:glycosyltransferase family 4 protein [Capsulimonas corticalis]BDI33044.1 glycosyl transferase [Capsulimonas corticalis]
MSLSVLQVASSFASWGGAELHILNLSDQLRQRGYDVTVVCRPGLWIDERAKAMGLQTAPATVKHQLDWTDFSQLRQIFRERKADVVHVHWSRDMVVPGIAAIAERVPVRILSRHMPYPFKSRIGAMFYSKVLFTKMVTVSNSVRDTLIDCGVSPEKLETIYHGTDVEAFRRTSVNGKEMRRELAIPDDHVAVGIVGRIAPEKGHSVLVEAAKILGDKYPVKYVIIGSGPDEQKIRDLTTEMGVADKFLFTGFRDDVNNAIQAMDIVTLPSTWNEPCSAVVQQAMALCKPVIGTLAGGTPEMIEEEETGLLVPVSDSAALASAIARLAGDAFLRKAMGTQGYARVCEHFSLSVMTDHIEALYQREYDKVRGAGAYRKAFAA